MQKVNKSPSILVTVALGIIAIIIVIVQILTIDEDSTKLEVALINILQLVFSIMFSWNLSKITFQNDYERNLKKFGIAAYRRMTDLDKGISNLIDKMTDKMNRNETSTHNIEVLLVMSDSLKQNIGSSIADWGDIIGNEIDTLQELKNIVKERNKLLSVESSESISTFTNSNLTQSNELDTKYNELLNQLPESMKIQIRENEKEDMRKQNEDLNIEILKNLEKIRQLVTDSGKLVLSGFWTSDREAYKIVRDIMEYRIGDILYIKILKSRRFGKVYAGDINLVNEDAERIGRITNMFESYYPAFSTAIRDYLKTDHIAVRLISLDEPEGNRIYFKVEVIEENSDRLYAS